MKAKFRTIDFKQYEITVNTNTRISDIKAELSNILKIEKESINLIYKSKLLDDNEVYSELNIPQDSAVLIHIQKVDTQKSPKKEEAETTEIGEKQKHKPKQKKKLEDPENFGELIQQLVEMGFEKNDSIKALRAAVYNVNQAAEFLLADFIPEPPSIFDIHHLEAEEEEDNDEGNEETTESVENEQLSKNTQELCQCIRDHPEFLPFLLNDFAKNNPAVAPFIEKEPCSFLASIGLDPKGYYEAKSELNQHLNEITSGLTDEERECVMRICGLGYDELTVLQYYIACDKDEEKTKECLNELGKE